MGKAVAVALVVSAAPAGAQTLNINFGPTAPSPTYAAAGQAGTWNAVGGTPGMTYDFVAVDGSPSGVTMYQAPTPTAVTGTDPSVTGDDATLLDSSLLTTGAETCLFFSGFTPGTYEVLIYAWVPSQPSVLSRTRQDQAPSTIDVGGAWPGHHAEGVTYARYTVTVDSGGMLPAHSGLATGQPSAALNGVQIRPLPSTGGNDASPIDYGDAGTTPPVHHGGCSTGGGAGAGVLLALLALVRRRR
jgi:uncharacterized protein (TIGR03382 family)